MDRGDEVLLSELCGNLLDNALKYTPEQGIVTARLERDSDAVTLVVEDSGPGIDDEHIHLALQPFHRLDNVGNVAGAGIGLALSMISHACTVLVPIFPVAKLGGLYVRIRFKPCSAVMRTNVSAVKHVYKKSHLEV